MQPPKNPDLTIQLKHRLLEMSPRAFELFAGDFLTYVGFEKVKVTRYTGDGGIDASGLLMAGDFRIPVGVQVKRYRKNVPRDDIDRFVGSLSYYRYTQGLFITTSGFASGALDRAANTIPPVLTMDGSNVASRMLKFGIGLQLADSNAGYSGLEESYFEGFEQQKKAFEEPAENSSIAQEVNPREDLITLKALSHLLRIDPDRTRHLIDLHKLTPDATQTSGQKSLYFFQRARVEEIQQELGLEARPVSSEEWRQQFLEFMRTKDLQSSYKPVLIKAIFKLVDRDGKVQLKDLVQEFKQYYLERLVRNLPAEFGKAVLKDVPSLSDKTIQTIMIDYPLNRFIIKNFISYSKGTGIVQIDPQIWMGLRMYEMLDILAHADEQLNYYYCARNNSSL